MSSFKKRLFEKTTAPAADVDVAPAAASHPPPNSDEKRTSPGRLLNAQNRIMEADALRTEAENKLADALERIKDLEASGTAADVDIDTLVEVSGRRRILSEAEDAELTDNLDRNPLIHPIVYIPLGDGRNEIVSGHNRVRIYRDKLKRTKIRGVPFHGSPQEVELGAAWSNLLAPSLPDFEKYRQFRRIISLTGMTQTALIEASGLSQSHVSRILSFDRLSNEVKAMLEAKPHSLGSTAAEKLAALVERGHETNVVAAVKALINTPGMTQDQAVALASPKAQKATQVSTAPIMIGKKKLCDVSIRNGVIGVRFSGKDGQTAAEQWGEKIAAFIRQEVEAER